MVERLGGRSDPRAPLREGRRVAALVATGGRTERLLVPTADLVPVPDGVGADEVAAVALDGVEARRVLAPVRLRAGDVVVVGGAHDGATALLAQMAVRAGARVIAVLPRRHIPRAREIGAVAVDAGADVPAAVGVVAPGGARAVFDLGAPGLRDPARLLRRGGTLVLPERGPDRRSPAELRADLLAVLDQLASGAIAARIARAFALHRIAEAVAYAGSGRAEGAVVVVGAVGPEC